MPLVYEEVKLDIGYLLDLLVENKVVIEIKNGRQFLCCSPGTSHYLSQIE